MLTQKLDFLIGLIDKTSSGGAKLQLYLYSVIDGKIAASIVIYYAAVLTTVAIFIGRLNFLFLKQDLYVRVSREKKSQSIYIQKQVKDKIMKTEIKFHFYFFA